MAVQKSRKSKAKAKSRRKSSNKQLSFSQVITDPVTGEKVLRHHVTKSGFYKGVPVTAKEVTESNA